MKIKFSDIKNELLRHCIIHLITDKEKGDEVIKRTHADDGNVDLLFKINGIEFPILKWFNRFDSNINDMIKEKAEEMVNERLIEIENRFNEVIEDFRESVLEKVKGR